MYNNIDLDKIDISGPPPTTEPDRQYYFMAKCRQIVKKKSAELGRPLFCHTKTFGWANTCGALATEKLGACEGIQSRAEVEERMRLW